MVQFVLTAGVANLLLGFALAVAARRALRDEPKPEPQPLPPEEPAPIEAVEPEPEPEEEPPEEPAEEVVPQHWVDRLQAEAIVARTLVEASAQVLRLEVGQYRAGLVAVENELRDPPDMTAVRSAVKTMRRLNETWLDSQRDAREHLASRIDTLNEYEEVGNSLDLVLLEQCDVIKSSQSTTEDLAALGDDEEQKSRLLDEVAALLNVAHLLRDAITDSLLVILRAESRLGDFDPSKRVDGLTGIRSRTGWETAIEEWWRNDPGRHRLLTLAMVDVDHFGRFNRRWGTKTGDFMIAACGRVLAETVRKDRGYDVVARFCGQRFVILFGDTGPRNALSGMERIRQTFHATEFEVFDRSIAMSISCAVTEVQKKDDVPALIERMKVGLTMAKKQGRNCTILDEGQGPATIEAPVYDVRGRVIEVTSA